MTSTIENKKVVGPRMIISDKLDVDKNRSKEHFLLTSSTSETRCPGVEVDNYKHLP